MHITYSLDAQHYRHYSLYMRRRTPSLDHRLFLLSQWIPLLIAGFLHIPEPWYVSFTVIMAVTVPWMFFINRLEKWLLKNLVILRPGGEGVHDMEVTEHGIRVRNNYLSMFAPWNNVADALDSADMIYVIIAPQFGFIVPKDQISPTRAKELVALMERWRRVAFDIPVQNPIEDPLAWPPAPTAYGE